MPFLRKHFINLFTFFLLINKLCRGGGADWNSVRSDHQRMTSQACVFLAAFGNKALFYISETPERSLNYLCISYINFRYFILFPDFRLLFLFKLLVNFQVHFHCLSS